jgi:hypothetical protein
VDVSAGLVLLIQPRDFRFTPVSFEFNYAAVGDEYVWIEKFFLGPDGFTWMIVACSVGGFMGLLVLAAIIYGIVVCVRRARMVKTQPSPLGGSSPGNKSEAMPLGSGKNRITSMVSMNGTAAI